MNCLNLKRLIIPVLLILFIAGCQEVAQELEEIIPTTQAIAVIRPVDDNSVSGQVSFTKEDRGIRIIADVNGLSPGKHGFHLHKLGDCTNLAEGSAGEIFNPFNKNHGGPDKWEHKVGDFRNLTADTSGHAHLEWIDIDLNLDGPLSIIGRSLLVHKYEDDYLAQPDGNSGPVIAYAIIGIDNPE
jgi:Cu-Zn family superoxide dismutase